MNFLVPPNPIKSPSTDTPTWGRSPDPTQRGAATRSDTEGIAEHTKATP